MSYVKNVDSTNAVQTKRMFARLMAVLVVFIMVSTAFVAVLARAEGTPEIWTSKDEYSPGETVEIYGGGFVKWVPVTITVSHPDIVEKTFVATPDLYGRFVCNDYVAEIVKDYSTPVTVTATQVLEGGNNVATTQFYDPAAYVEGWTLMPHQRWTTGDVKGYNEGDSVPMIAVINKKQLHGANVVTMQIGFDFYNKTPTEGAYGIDYLTQYWLNPPAAPFNTYANSSSPFYVNPAEGALSGVHRVADNVYDQGWKMTVQVWELTFTFATGATSATIRFGAHLAVSDPDSGIKGASYWPGESLHVRLVNMDPAVNNGNRDVPISVNEVKGPPEMELMKECDPEVVLEGDTITFTVHWMNLGEAPAYCVRLWDELPWSVDLVSGSFLYNDSSNPLPMPPIPGPVETGTGWQWDIGMVPGATLGVPFEAWLTFEAVVITSEPGWYENWVYLTYTDSHGSEFPQLSAVCRFYIPEPPSIMIVKSGPWYAHDGDVITYTYNVSNNGPVDLVNVDVVDSIVGTIATDLSLASGDWVILSGTYTVKTTDPRLLVNTVLATGEDEYGREVMDDDSWTVIILRPHVDVEKVVSMPCAKAGEQVWYTISWVNPPEWETTLYNVTLKDSLFGEFALGTLEPGETGEQVIPYNVTNAWDPLVNTVKIRGEDLIHLFATDTDEARVDVVHPKVQITKTADKACGKPGETIIYTITVTNPLDADVWLNGSYGDSTLGGTWTFTNLKPGESVSQMIQTALPDVDPYVNEAWVFAMDHQRHIVEAKASLRIDVVHPDIEITKTVSMPCGMPGEEVVWKIVVTNPRTADVWLNGTVYDPVLGMEWDFENLKPGESREFVVPFLLPGGPTEIVNEAWVEAYDHQDHLVTARTGMVRVDIVYPDVEIEKTASLPCAGVGEEITWTITVTNPQAADVWLNGTAEDKVLNVTWEFHNLMPGQSVSWQVTMRMPDGPTEIINTATVTAKDHQGHVVTDTSDPVRVDIVHPAIEIEKTSDLPCAGVGELIVWTIIVTNPASADVWLNGTIDDPAVWESWTFNDLKPGESIVKTVVQKMPDVDYFENWAYVYATDHQQHLVSAADNAIVDVVHPEVVIEKSVSMPCGKPGEEVVWKIVVTNPGRADVWLNGTVSDPMLNGTWSFFDLMPGESEIYLVPMLLPEGPTEIVNTATVTAKDHQGHEVTDTSDPVRVDIVHPAVEITKTASLPCAKVGEEVTFTINVTNPSSADVWLNGTVDDPMLSRIWSFFDLMPGESFVRTVTIPMPEGPTEFINVATVTAYDHQRHEVSAKASVRVDIVHPDIRIVKSSSLPCAGVGEEITWTINVTNPDTADVWLNGTIDDPLLLHAWSFFDLMPGESFVARYTMVMPDGPTELINVATVTAYDHQQHRVFAQSNSVRVDIVHPDVEVIKTADRYLAHEGDVITYLITVVNPITADVMLNGTVVDSMFGAIGTFSNLVVGGSVSFGFTYTVTNETPEVILNTATVTAKDHQNHTVTDDDEWNVTVLRPDIEVTKIGPKYASVGDVITYYVNVTNIGDCDLFNVTVVDSLYGLIVPPIPVILEGQTAHLTFVWTVPAGPGDLTNRVVARGEDRLHLFVEDDAWWNVSKFATIEGYKAADLNVDKDRDELEPLLEGWVIVLNGTEEDGTLVGPLTTQTDVVGHYIFTGLKPGIYTVSEVLLAGWRNISAATNLVLLGSGSIVSLDFLNMPYGDISGAKFEDKNLNGHWDLGEPGIANWTIYLDGTTTGGIVVDLETTTSGQGLYVFTDLLPGLYLVTEESKAGWYATTPTMQVVDTRGLDPFNVTGIDFGNVQLGEISGFKWLDENMNGYEDGMEPKLANWTIVLDGVLADGVTTVHKETVTGPGGYYAFTGLLPGVYVVSEVLKDGWKNITPLSRVITIIPGSNVTCAKFGNVPLGCIEGWKFLDWDMDGMKDGNEPGIPGWRMTLTGWLANGTPPYSEDNATHIVPVTILTGPDGSWKFCGLLPGMYFVTEETREDWYHTTPVSQHFLITPWRIVPPCVIIGPTHVVDVKFGNVPYSCLWGYKWNDLNGDGRHQDNEPGIANWTIHIVGVRNDGVAVNITVVTGPDGKWQTCFIILPGSYRIYEELRDGWTPTSMWAYSITIPMNIEPVKHQYNFMNFQNGKIKGFKYEDMNGNGRRDAGDVPIQNWVITLENASHEVIATTITAGDGSFEFIGLPLGTYWVCEQMQAGWVPTTPVCVNVTIASGTEVVLDAFLNVELSTVFGYKFEDLNSNGIRDQGEPGIPGWKIYMIWDLDSTVYNTTTDADGYYEFTGLMPDSFYMIYEEKRVDWCPTNATWEQFSVSSGTTHRVHDFMNFHCVYITLFKYEDMRHDGVYYEGVDRPIPGWTFYILNATSSNFDAMQTDSDGKISLRYCSYQNFVLVREEIRDGWCQVSPPNASVKILIMSGKAINLGTQEEQYVYEFGNFECVDITLFKYEDVDGDGVYNSTIDEPIEGWTFWVYDSAQGLPMAYVTDAGGYVNLTFCTYESFVLVVEEVRQGWCSVNPQWGSYEILIASGIAINLDTLKEQYLYQFGNFQCAKIVVFKYWDKCSNGWYDEGFDAPLRGWFINVLNAEGVSVAHGYTDEHGYFNVTICKAGNYTVVEEDRQEWSHINPASGQIEVTVQSGDVWMLHFGNYLKVKVPVFKYEDVNSDGDYDLLIDRPIPDWHFDLIRNDGYTYSGETDVNGMLVFEVNRSGIYRIVEEDRVNWTHINPASGMVLLNIISGVHIPLQMFGNFHDVCIPVFKFADVDGDEYYEPWDCDVPVPGWNFTLWVKVGMTWVMLETKATNENGFLCFKVNRSGEYKVTEEARDGWIWIIPRSGEYRVVVHSGTVFECALVFGNFKFGKITGHKYNDLNGNGTWDLGEPGLAGWTIHFRVTWPFFMEGFAVTDKNGYYEFTGLPPGLYAVWEDQQPGWNATSDPLVYVMIRGNSHKVVDFFNFEIGCIDGYKYEDVNDNGQYDPGIDTPIRGWTITLMITTGIVMTPEGPISAIAIVNVTTTDWNGYYRFCGLGHGLYIVREEVRDDWVPNTPTSVEHELLSGEKWRAPMFLNYHLGSICGDKFDDMNSNGQWDDGEDPIEGWQICLIRKIGSFVMPLPEVTYTDANGSWCFTGLRAGDYRVWEVLNDSWTPTTNDSADVTIWSGRHVLVPPFGNFKNVCIPLMKYNDVNGDGRYEIGTDTPIEGWEFLAEGPAFPGGLKVYTGPDGKVCVLVTKAGWYTITEEARLGWKNTTASSITVYVESGDVFKRLMFGNFQEGKIEGYKYYDWNANATRDDREEGLQNWVIVLLGPGGPYTDMTDENGYYEFTDLMAGDYTIYEDLLVAPPGWRPTTPPTVPVSIRSGDVKSVLFGNVLYGNITGCKFYDKDLDGVRDEGEPGLPGWTILLSGVTDHGIVVNRHTMTNACGCYKFLDLMPGNYSITEVMPGPEWVATTPLPQTSDSSGAMREWSDVVDIGNVRYAKICGFKFLDTYGTNYPFWPNGIFDFGEFGLGNWKITLQGWTDTGVRVDEVRYTDNVHRFWIGWYCFGGILPGRYWVNETLLYGYYATRPIANLVMVYPFPMGPVCIRIDFGNLVPSRDPQVPFMLEKGWNLWSTPLDVGGLTAKSLLAAIGPNARAVSRLDEAAGRYVSYVTGYPDTYDFPIVLGEGYFVYVKAKTHFSLEGNLTSASSVPVLKGWNLVGYDKLEGTMASEIINAGVGCKVRAVTYLDAELGVYKSFVKGYSDAYDFEVTSGRAYFVYVDAAGSLSL